jgi:hypothetical protein
LSHTLPDRLIEQTTPLSVISRWNCSLVYWLPRVPYGTVTPLQSCSASGTLRKA